MFKDANLISHNALKSSFCFIFFCCFQMLAHTYIDNILSWHSVIMICATNLCAVSFVINQIQQTGWDKLFISFIPAGSGKAIGKTTKANVRNGTCKWADPIYETTRLLQDIKTKQYDEKLYKFVVAMVVILILSLKFLILNSYL